MPKRKKIKRGGYCPAATCYNDYMRKLLLAVLFLAPVAAGCIGGKANIYERQKESANAKECCFALPSYYFDRSQSEVFSVCKQVLEAYEYKINDDLSKYGFIYGQSGKRDSFVVTRIFITPWILLGIGVPRYEEQVSFAVNIFVKPEGDGTNVKVAFFREAWDNKGELLRSDRIRSEAMYNKFFEDLDFLFSQDLAESK